MKDAIEINEPLGGLMRQRLLSVGAVDLFQGQERDIIAISLTRSNRSGAPHAHPHPLRGRWPL